MDVGAQSFLSGLLRLQRPPAQVARQCVEGLGRRVGRKGRCATCGLRVSAADPARSWSAAARVLAFERQGHVIVAMMVVGKEVLAIGLLAMVVVTVVLVPIMLVVVLAMAILAGW